MQRGSTLFIFVVTVLAVSAFAERGHGRYRGQNRRGGFRDSDRRPESHTQENTNAELTANSENKPRFGQLEENKRGNSFGQMSDRPFDGQRFGGQDNGNVNAEEAGVSRPTGLRGGEGRSRFGQGGRRFNGNRYDNAEERDTNIQNAQSLGEGRKPWGPGGRDGPDRHHHHHHHHRHHHGRRNETEGNSDISEEGRDGDEAGNFTGPFRFRPFGRKPFGRRNDTSYGHFDGEDRLNRTRGQFKQGRHHHELHNETDMERPYGDKRPGNRGFFGNRGGRPFGGKVHNDEEAVEGTQTVEPVEPETMEPESIFPEILDTDGTNFNGNEFP